MRCHVVGKRDARPAVQLDVYALAQQAGLVRCLAHSQDLLCIRRLKKDDVLEHFVRVRIFGHIEANPGVHYSQIMVTLNLGNGVLAYHLDVLEREGFVRTRRQGMYKYFYPTGTSIGQNLGGTFYDYFGEANSKKAEQLSKFQRNILNIIRNEEGISQKLLAERLGKSKQLVSYHVRKMTRAGFIRKEGERKGSSELYVKE